MFVEDLLYRENRRQNLWQPWNTGSDSSIMNEISLLRANRSKRDPRCNSGTAGVSSTDKKNYGRSFRALNRREQSKKLARLFYNDETLIRLFEDYQMFVLIIAIVWLYISFLSFFSKLSRNWNLDFKEPIVTIIDETLGIATNVFATVRNLLGNFKIYKRDL